MIQRGQQEGKGRSIWSALLRITGILMIALVILSSAPASVPRIFGYQVYQIVSGSMEPAIPVGSAIYVKEYAGEALQSGDVIAFWVDDSVIAHRILQIDYDAQQVFTKGDANEAPDMNPVSFEQIIGKVEYSVPVIGTMMMLYAIPFGKICVFIFLMAGVLFQLLAGRLQNRNEKHRDELNEASAKVSPEKAAKRKLYKQVKCVGLLLVVAFAAVIGCIGYYILGYIREDRRYKEAEAEYIKKVMTDSQEDAQLAADICPIEVDFAALQEKNPEIIGWIYCYDSPINYPICQGKDDEYYLSHSYDKKDSKSGSIFLEAQNFCDFSDANSILYGHHMKNGSMFATLSCWAEQSYYEEHPYMWLLTPEHTYRIDIFSGYMTDATSDTYSVFRNYGGQMQAYLQQVVANSDFGTDVDVSDTESRFVVLSTCEYSSENARYVLHGKLVP